MIVTPSASALSPARSGGRIVAVLGPTNTGKTHLAVERMTGHASGMIGLPLRLLAREIYERVVARCGPAAVALLTGEEKILPARARYFVCTVEAMPRDREVDFLAVDEIQLCADPERGHVFTNRLLHARGREETMFLGAETMRPLLRALLPEAEFVTRPRFSRLSYAGARKLQRLPRRSAIVGFSADSVYAIAELIRRQRGGAAVVLGALSPRTRNAQVALYQSGEVDFLVATDAIGMGLNMDVDHVAFSALHKFDGHHHRRLGAAEIAQIAGRAGRYMNDGSFGVTGEAGDLDPELIDQIENHRFDPVRVLQWRSNALDFTTLPGLIGSLEAPPSQRGLVRAREASDLRALRTLGRESAIESHLRGPAALRLLWQVCQIPDFRKTMADEHIRLLRAIFLHLIAAEGVLPEDWVAEQVGRLDRSDGDLDALAARIAHIRTWTFVSNRQSWLRDARHWQERTRAIEDRLSDALHERLTQRFVDRRTSVLLRRLHQREELLAALRPEGDVLVEGEYVGRLSGFRFLADPRADGIHGRTLRHAASRALRGEIAARAARLAEAPDAAIRLDGEGRLWWEDHLVATLAAGASAAPGMIAEPLAPDVSLLADDLLSAAAQARIRARLHDWLRSHIEQVLAPLARLRRAESLTGLARGIAFRLIEALGVLERAGLAEDLRALGAEERAQLRRLGVRFGARHVFVPALLKPQATQLRLLLWQAAHGGALTPPPPGRVSFPVAPDVSADLLRIAGFAVLGGRAVRIDMLERLLDLIRPLAQAGPFAATAEMMALLGCGPADLAAILEALGYRARSQASEDGGESLLWEAREAGRRSKGPRPSASAAPRARQARRAAKRHADSPFAELLRLKQAMEAPS